MAKISMTFTEIEHSGDLEKARVAVVQAGGVIIREETDFDSEFCAFIIEIGEENPSDFRKKANEIFWE